MAGAARHPGCGAGCPLAPTMMPSQINAINPYFLSMPHQLIDWVSVTAAGAPPDWPAAAPAANPSAPLAPQTAPKTIPIQPVKPKAN